MSREKLVLDIDDVTANTTESLRIFINSQYGLALEREHYLEEDEYYGYYERLWERYGLKSDGVLESYHEQMAKDQSDILPVEGAVEALHGLSRVLDIHPATSRPEVMEAATDVWLRSQFEPIFHKPVFLNYGVNAKKSKGQVCEELGASYLIDDNIDHCKSAIEKGVTAILFGKLGWHINVPQEVVRCHNWQEVKDFFNA